jgi:hypothetical protein
MLKHWGRARGREIDGEDIETEGDGGSVGFREAAEIGGSHAPEHVLLVRVDVGFGGGEGVGAGGGGAGFDLEEDKDVAVPGDEVEVAGEAAGAPAAGDDGVAEGTKVEEGGVFTAGAGEQVRGGRVTRVGAGAERSVKAAFKGQEAETRHGGAPAGKNSAEPAERTTCPQGAGYTWLCTRSTTQINN